MVDMAQAYCEYVGELVDNLIEEIRDMTNDSDWLNEYEPSVEWQYEKISGIFECEPYCYCIDNIDCSDIHPKLNNEMLEMAIQNTFEKVGTLKL